MPSSFTSYIVRHYTETRATLVQLCELAFCGMHLPCVHGENEFVELRRIFGDNLTAIDEVEESSKTLEALGDGQHAALDVDPAEGRRRRAGARSREGRSSATPTGLLYGHTHTANSSMGTSEKADSFKSPAGDCEAAKTRGSLEEYQGKVQPERMAATVTDGSPHTTKEAVYPCWHQSGRCSTWNQTSSARQNQAWCTTTAPQHWTAKQRSPEEEHAWAEVSRATRAGKDPTGAQARAHHLHNLRKGKARQQELKKLKASFRGRRKGHTAKKLKVENEETADREQWTQGFFSHCKDRFTDQIRDDQEQQRWVQTIEERAARDPLQEKSRIQVAETFAALAEMKTAKGPGGNQAMVEMWQNLPVQLKLKVAAHFDRYLTMPRHVNQLDTWRQVLMVAIPKQAGADDFDEHRYLSLLATMSKWIVRILVE